MTKILVAEDNEMNRKMLVRRLEALGFEVVIALDGEDAVAQVKATWPDVVLMDISMPRVDGWEARRRLADDPVTSYVKVIALTAQAQASDRARAEALGFDGFATKPVDLDALVKTIGSLLGS